MGFTTVAPGQPYRATHVNQFSRYILGVTKDINLAATTTSATDYTAVFTNEDTSAGLMSKWRYGATDAVLFNKTGATFNIPVFASSVLSGLLTSPGAIPYAVSSTAQGQLALGSAYQNLSVNAAGTAPTYQASLQSLLASAGSLVVASGANTPAHLPKSTTAFAEFVMNSGATGQTWANGVLANAVTAGDTFVATGLNAITRVAKGTAFQEWVMDPAATGATWASGALSLAVTSGDLFLGNGTNALARLAKGSAGDYLRSNATGVAWETVTAGSTLDKLGEVSGTGTSATLTFTGVSGSYRALMVAVVGRSDSTAAQFTEVRLTFESSPTTTAYSTQYLIVAGGTGVTMGSNIGTGYHFMGYMPCASSPANLYGSVRSWVPEYGATGIHKTIECKSLGPYTMAAAGLVLVDTLNVFSLTAAISFIRFTLQAGNWSTSSRATLWGLPA